MPGAMFLIALIIFAAAGFFLGLHDQNAFATVAGAVTFVLGIPLTVGGGAMTDTLGCKVPLLPQDSDPLDLGFDVPSTGPSYEEQEATYDQCIAFYNTLGIQMMVMAVAGAIGIFIGNIVRTGRA